MYNYTSEHLTTFGVHVHAWIALQELILIIKERLKTACPQKETHQIYSFHPAFFQPRYQLVTWCELKADYREL